MVGKLQINLFFTFYHPEIQKNLLVLWFFCENSSAKHENKFLSNGHYDCHSVCSLNFIESYQNSSMPIWMKVPSSIGFSPKYLRNTHMYMLFFSAWVSFEIMFSVTTCKNTIYQCIKNFKNFKKFLSWYFLWFMVHYCSSVTEEWIFQVSLKNICN